MVLDNEILKQILNEEILVINTFDVAVVVTFQDRDGLFKDFFIEKRIESNNPLNAAKAVTDELENLHKSLLPQHIEHVIIGVTPYIEGVD